MRRPNLEGLSALPKLQRNFELRPMTAGDAGKVADLLRLSFEDESWTLERAQSEFVTHPDVVTTWVIQHGEKIISTATSLMAPQTHPGSGCVHWVGTDPAHRGQGMGYLVSLAVLHDFIRLQCRDAILFTDDERLPAIKTYLNLGFVPEYQDDSHPQRWEAVMQKLQTRKK